MDPLGLTSAPTGGYHGIGLIFHRGFITHVAHTWPIYIHIQTYTWVKFNRHQMIHTFHRALHDCTRHICLLMVDVKSHPLNFGTCAELRRDLIFDGADWVTGFPSRPHLRIQNEWNLLFLIPFEYIHSLLGSHTLLNVVNKAQTKAPPNIHYLYLQEVAGCHEYRDIWFFVREFRNDFDIYFQSLHLVIVYKKRNWGESLLLEHWSIQSCLSRHDIWNNYINYRCNWLNTLTYSDYSLLDGVYV